MATYQRLKSILNKNGKKYAVDLNEWGEAVLSGSELTQFLADMAELDSYFSSQIEAGNLSVLTVRDQVETTAGLIEVQVGARITFSDQYQIPAKETAWYAKMAADPNITFNDLVLISGD